MPENVSKFKTYDNVEHDIEDSQARADLQNVYTKTEADALLAGKVDSSDVYDKSTLNSMFDSKADKGNVYTKTEANDLLDLKADASTVYTKTEADTLLDGKANTGASYTKSEEDNLLLGKANANNVYTKTETDTLLGDKANTADVYSKTDADALLNAKANASDVYTKAEDDALLLLKADASSVYTKSEVDDTVANVRATIVQLDNKVDLNYQNTAKLDSANTFEGGNTLKDHYTTIKMSNLDITDSAISPLDGNAGIPIVDKNGVPLAYINIWQRTENGETRCDLAIGTEIGTTNPNGLVLVNGAPASVHIFAQNTTAGGTIGDKLQAINDALQPHVGYLGRIIVEINGIPFRWAGGADWGSEVKLRGSTEYNWYLLNLTSGNLQLKEVYTNGGAVAGGPLNNQPFNSWRIYSI